MTYDEAVKKKKAMPLKIKEKDLEMRLLITPELKSDLIKYGNKIIKRSATDETAKLFSSNGKFALRYIWSDMSNMVDKLV